MMMMMNTLIIQIHPCPAPFSASRLLLSPTPQPWTAGPYRLLPPSHAHLSRCHFARGLSEPLCVLIALDAFPPLAAHFGAVDEDVELLGMVPGLRVLVAGALDPNVPVRNQQLDVAAAGVEAVVDGAVLVFRYVVCNVHESTPLLC